MASQFWLCSACSVENGFENVICVLCGLHRPTAPPLPRATSWQCSVCTLKNEAASDICSVCNAEREGGSEIDDRLGAVEYSMSTFEKALQGDADAQFTLGSDFSVGRNGLAADMKQAAHWYQLAAEQGHAEAAFNFGYCLANGTGVAQDEKAAVEMYRRAGDKGHAAAQFNVGWHLANGVGVVQDEQAAISWFRRSAEAGYAAAQFNMGYYLANGKAGLAEDKKAAFEWYRKSAEQGDSDGQYNLACCYRDGDGVAQNLTAAVLWLRKAAAQDNSRAKLVLSWAIAQEPTAAASQSEKPDVGEVMAKWGITKPILRIDVAAGDLVGPFVPLTPSGFSKAMRCKHRNEGKLLDVVVKAPNSADLDKSLTNEWLALQQLPKHPNVLHFIGVCQDFAYEEGKRKVVRPFSFVTEYMQHGSIEDFFREPENKGKSAQFLLPWARDIAAGMAFLHENRLVHRDLASRNVLVNNEHRAVIADFGMLRPMGDAHGKLYYRSVAGGARPVECAPEAGRHGLFSAASDVYSFGITLFEIATECAHIDAGCFGKYRVLYASTQAEQDFLHQLVMAYVGFPDVHAKLPPTVPAAIRELIFSCLAFDPEQRPSAAQVAKRLEDVAVSLNLTA